jgi:hypothetical protein
MTRRRHPAAPTQVKDFLEMRSTRITLLAPARMGVLAAPLLALSLAGSSRAQGLYEKDYPTCLAMCQVNNEDCIKRITDPKSWQPRECKNRNDICLHECRQRYNK